ncbi:uncharacterized protein YjbI with pentapeptide repeats [Variovorax beijingensis]|uniref:Uncharacterized protein YjbI with pentapeptide repeats n=1 Tax=Variovorax beijingensis TaxID=2496117 RepID=A0A561CGI9_9BURK|nr:DUF2169 domain-containing protein [Variovorax beijingensis]TWD90351.1 uncharacterized protein YjbI with pentapeptide repeats [Variovorax beijingensis]
MKIVKPFRLSLLTRPYRWKADNHLGIASIALVSLKADPQLQPEQELWQMVSEVLDPGSVLDLGVPKAEAEVLVSGFAYTSHQAEKSQCAVRLRMDTVDKLLLVSGDRYWLDGRSTAPLPFEQMPLDWRHTYGGPGFAQNPLGIGGQDEIVNGVHTRRLPNVEAATHRLARREQAGTPAALCGYLPDWPQRMAHIGRQYDSTWLANGYPGFADDMDWRFFNAAPQDQRWRGRGTLPPGAAYELWNMHPQIPVMKGNLPDWNAVCHVSFSDDGEMLRSVPMHLSTAWFFPDRERVILIWHGATPVREDDAADVRHIMPALELRDAPRPLQHYREVLLKRIDPEKAAIHVLRDSDLAPRPILGDWRQMQLPDTMAEPLPRNLRAGLLRDHEARRAELLEKGLDPELYLEAPWEPEAIPDFDDLPEYLERAEASAVQTRERLQKEAERIESERNALPTQGAAAEAARAQAVMPDPQQLQREMSKGDRYDQANPPEAEGDADTEKPDEPAAPADPLMHLGYLHSAHLGGAAPAMPSFRSAKLRRRLSAAEPGRRTFAHMNLIGADLSGMDLRGADLSHAILTDANLAGAQLDDCNLSQAILARANLTGASLARARLDEANIGGACFDRTNFEGASLREVHAGGARFVDCRMAGTRMDQVQLHEASFARCDFRGSRWHQVAFLQMALEDLHFEQAEMLQVVWIECQLRRVSFADAKLTRCGFVAATLDSSVDFSNAVLDACSVAQGSSLAGVRLSGARLKQCGMRGMPLMAADLSAAHLDACDLSECDFSDAKLNGLSAGESLFVRADFTRASLRGAILIDANLSKAVLTHCDLRGANLFRTDVSQALIDGTTLLDGAYTRHAKVWPARPAGASAP